MLKWINEAALKDYPAITEAEAREALSLCISGVLHYAEDFADRFPYACSKNGFYEPVPNRGWTTGFYTGQIWLAYENADTEEDREKLLQYGRRQVESFDERIRKKIDVDHHDMGFLYTPSCVAAYKLTGSEKAKKAAILAADQLVSRFQPVGEFLQAWGEMGAKDNYRFIIDCLLNLPLLYWADTETHSSDHHYRETAEKHIHTAMRYVIREDDSTWHTIFMDPVTGKFDHGATCQGYQDGSAWARGQAWGIYGTAMAYRYTGRDDYIGYFKRVTAYFLNHLPKDLCPCWDLTFGDGDGESRDSSSAVIAACGMLEMSRFLPETESLTYTGIAKKLLKAMADHYSVRDIGKAGGRLLHGTYSKKSPYNTCTPEGVDECVLWGDYYYMEGLNRVLHPSWNVYW
ncbi:MAG: glycoside hydrolase family 88 protein [Lachnospiraceae bacterium]|nr:glycoside hydrolase family 88 protein [Lachnospiraceae bacterium]